MAVHRREVSRRERLSQIRSYLEVKGQVSTSEFAEMFGVSETTVRRDLGILEKEGILLRTHGGAAVLTSGTTAEHSYAAKFSLRLEEKKSIGRYAAELISDGDTVILDSGTTTIQIAKHLGQKRNLTIVTNGLPIANELMRKHPSLSLIVVGGIVRTFSQSTVGPQAEQLLASLNADKLFLAAEGIHPARGLSVQDPLDAKVKQAMIAAAREVIVVADSSKIGLIKMVSFMHLERVDLLITDSGVPDDFASFLAAEGIPLAIAED